ncbi:MAG: hypothetical protein Ct9H300mP32_6810 [Verrucomicrobiota bacterium]|nr:MAG: hypothetical protein Ct9H300mP32_6810 [Verrucomicrobiota bacterium]
MAPGQAATTQRGGGGPSQRLAHPVGGGAALPGKSSWHRPVWLNCATNVPCRVAIEGALIIAVVLTAKNHSDGDGNDRRDHGDGNTDREGGLVTHCCRGVKNRQISTAPGEH